MLERMFFNLMENSQRHGGKVTNIWVEVEDRGGNKVIVYRDDGKGIGKENKEKISRWASEATPAWASMPPGRYWASPG